MKNDLNKKISLEYWLGGVMSTLFASALTVTAIQQIGLASWRVAENDQTGLFIVMMLIIWAIGAFNVWALSSKRTAYIGLPAMGIVLGSILLIPYGHINLGANTVNTIIAAINGQTIELNESACCITAAILGFFITIGIWIVNQNLVTRCIAAVITFATLMVLVFTDSTFNVFCLMLMFAYICYVLLQFCAARSDKALAAQSGGRKRGKHDSTYVAVCLITALLAAIIPSSPDPIPWGEIGQRIRDALTIDDIMLSDEDDGASVSIGASSLYTENEELAFVANPVVMGLTETLGDIENHAISTVYDTYTGSGWQSSGVQTGAETDDAIELAYFLSKNEVEDLSFLSLKQVHLAVKNPLNESAFTFNKSAGSVLTSSGYTILNLGDNRSFFYFEDGYVDESYVPEKHPVYSTLHLSLDWTDPQLISMLRNADNFRYNSSEARSKRVSILSDLNSMLSNTSLVTSVQGYSSSISFSRTFLEDSVERSKLIRQQYTQLPEMPARVKQLAQSIVGRTTGTYDSAQLLAGYLASNYTYTGEAPDVGMDILGTDVSGTDLTFSDLTDQLITEGGELDLAPTGTDAVDAFLFETLEGGSAEYASALTVMLRSLGIPARYVEGYYINNELDNTYYTALPYKYVAVLNKSAHAWVEYYIEGFGWIPVDPVPGFEYVSAATALAQSGVETYLYGNQQEVALILNPKTLSGQLYSFGENHLVSQTLDTFDGNQWTQGSTDYNDSTYYDALEFAFAMSKFNITTDSAFLFEYDIQTRFQNNTSLTLPAKAVNVSIANRSFEVDQNRGNLYIDPESYTSPPEYSTIYLSVDWEDERIKNILRSSDSFDYDIAAQEGNTPSNASTKALLDLLGIEEIEIKNSTRKIDNLILPQFVPGGGKTEIPVYNYFDTENFIDFYTRRANDFDKRYTQLPANLSEQTVELAESITKSKDSTYDKALAIQEYLEVNFTYTGQPEDVGLPEAYKQLLENPDENSDLWRGIHVPAEDVVYTTESLLTIEPGNGNYVDRFIASGEGDSTAFASAMTVMLRSIGIPARYVEGYYANEHLSNEVYDRLELLQYIVINQNEHAWVEVYFEGIGWVPFDPSPTFEYVSQYTSNKALYGVIDEENMAEAQERMDAERAAQQAAQTLRIVVIVLISLVVLAIALLIAIPNIQRANRRRRMVSGRKLEYNDRLGLRLVDDTMCELALGGLPRNADETIIAYCDRVCSELWLSESIRIRLAAAIEYMDEMCYSTEITHRVKPMALRFLNTKVRYAVIRHIGFFKRIFRFVSFRRWTQERYSAK